jgi:creatinine amidohydrolase
VRKVRWEEMLRDEMRAAIVERPLCYLAYGLCEPHGLHNALGLDGLKAQALVEEAAAAHGGVVAPTTWWHTSKVPISVAFLEVAVGADWQGIGATYLTDVPPRLLYEGLVYQLRAAELAGFRAAVLVTGHYGGLELDMRLVAEHYSACRPLRTAAVADCELIRYGAYRGDHAGPCETSQLWALRPDLVDMARLPTSAPGRWTFGSTPEASRASRAEGRRIVDSQVRSLGQLSDRLLKEAETQPAATWYSFEAADAIWQRILSTEKDWVASRPAEDAAEYIRERATLFPTPGW